MGFMDRFNQQQPQAQTQLGALFNQARQLSEQSGGTQAAIQQLADSGMTCTMPSGKTMTVSEIVKMAEGKTPQQLLAQLLQA